MKKCFLIAAGIFLLNAAYAQASRTALSTEKNTINKRNLVELPQIATGSFNNNDTRVLKEKQKIFRMLPESTPADLLLFDTAKLRRPQPAQLIKINR